MTDSLKDIAVITAKRIHDQKYTGIILSGNTTAIAKTLLDSAWNNLYPDEQIPEMFIFDKQENALLYKNEMPADDRLLKAKQLIETKYPALLGTESKLCYVDEFIQSGEKYRGLKELFERLHMPRVDFIFFSALASSEWDQELFIASKNDEVAGELVRLSLETYGIPSTPEAIAENGTPEHQEQIKQELQEKLKEIGTHIKRS